MAHIAIGPSRAAGMELVLQASEDADCDFAGIGRSSTSPSGIWCRNKVSWAPFVHPGPVPQAFSSPGLPKLNYLIMILVNYKFNEVLSLVPIGVVGPKLLRMMTVRHMHPLSIAPLLMSRLPMDFLCRNHLFIFKSRYFVDW